MADHLPQEITTEILSWVTAKYVLRFRSVCKTWREIIDEPRFPLLHFKRSTPYSSFIFSRDWQNAYLINRSTYNPELLEATNIKISFSTIGRILSRSCVNEFLCVNTHDFLLQSIYTHIYNPTTRDVIELPTLTYSTDQIYRSSAFGLDQCSGKYKVVCLFSSRFEPSANIRVLTLGSNSWRIVDNTQSRIRAACSVTYVNGSLHWLTSENIVRLDLASERLSSIAWPLLEIGNREGYKILNMSGFLTLVGSSSASLVEVWIMKDYTVAESWTKILIEKTPSCFPGMHIRDVRPFSFNKSGKMLIAYDNKIVAYNKGSYTHVHFQNNDEVISIAHFCCDDIFPIIESLVPVQRLLQN